MTTSARSVSGLKMHHDDALCQRNDRHLAYVRFATHSRTQVGHRSMSVSCTKPEVENRLIDLCGNPRIE